jgi:dipeptidyl aminopeptidase/acylaminoacyl peptidase
MESEQLERVGHSINAEPGLAAFLLIASFLAAAVIFTPAAIRRAYRAPRIPERRSPRELGLPYQTISIPTAKGKRLFAWFVPAEGLFGKAPAVAVMHGWGGNAEHMLPFAQLLYAAGYAVLLLDARNHGRSDPDDFSSLPRFAEDLGHGLDWLARQPGVDARQLFLLGHSVGAGAALLLAAQRREPAAMVSLAAFAHPADLMRRHLRAHHIPFRPLGWLVLRHIERTIKARFDDIAPCNTIRRVRCPVLLVHGEADTLVPPADARRIYANRRDDRTELLLLPATSHDSPGAISLHGQALTAFLRRYMTGLPKSLGDERKERAMAPVSAAATE